MTPSAPRPPLGRSPAAGRDAAHESCITCSDATTPMRVVEVDRKRALAVCAEEDGRRHTVDVGIVGEVAPDELLLVHAGTALVRERV